MKGNLIVLIFGIAFAMLSSWIFGDNPCAPIDMVGMSKAEMMADVVSIVCIGCGVSGLISEVVDKNE